MDGGMERVSTKLHISLAKIKAATDNFHERNLIGVSGFGKVYTGVLVKRATHASRQGLPEFQAEIVVLSGIRHRHLVSLIGYCSEQAEMILVYEYMEKGTLRSHLYGSEAPSTSTSTSTSTNMHTHTHTHAITIHQPLRPWRLRRAVHEHEHEHAHAHARHHH